jgi:L-alanine-DL-glutamate epimerase-like enolase superfamily enzyme
LTGRPDALDVRVGVGTDLDLGGLEPLVDASRIGSSMSHNFGTWIGLLANAHLVAAGPEVQLVEYPIFENDPLVDASGDPGMYPFGLAFNLVKGQPPVENGRLTVPDELGLGFEGTRYSPDIAVKF